MFVSFFQELKQAGVPVTLREYLTLLEAMGVIWGRPPHLSVRVGTE